MSSKSGSPQHLEKVAAEMFQLTRRWRAALDARLQPYGLSEAAWRAMLHLSMLGMSASQTQLAARMGVEDPTLVRLIDRMERDQWLERTADVTDRRKNLIEPTIKGRAIIDTVAQAAEQLRAEVFAGLSKDDVAAMDRMLTRMHANLDLAASPVVSPQGLNGKPQVRAAASNNAIAKDSA